MDFMIVALGLAIVIFLVVIPAIAFITNNWFIGVLSIALVLAILIFVAAKSRHHTTRGQILCVFLLILLISPTLVMGQRIVRLNDNNSTNSVVPITNQNQQLYAYLDGKISTLEKSVAAQNLKFQETTLNGIDARTNPLILNLPVLIWVSILFLAQTILLFKVRSK